MNRLLYPGHHDNDEPSTNMARKLANELIVSSDEIRKQTLQALDTDLKSRVIEELIRLRKEKWPSAQQTTFPDQLAHQSATTPSQNRGLKTIQRWTTGPHSTLMVQNCIHTILWSVILVQTQAQRLWRTTQRKEPTAFRARQPRVTSARFDTFRAMKQFLFNVTFFLT